MLVAMRLILASSSPRRQELLRQAGYEFEVRPSSVPEEHVVGETPEDFVRRLATAKALQVAAGSPTGSVVLGADTVVVVRGEILGKPLDAEDASRMLSMLSGRAHQVVTGVCLVRAPDRMVAVKHAATRVRFRRLDEAEIRDYVASGEPADKAGAYAIQGRASRFVTRIAGCYFNVVGLPISLVDELLRSTRTAT
ncbi:MAG TPA: Maf family protein [Terriglobia bacterium]